MLFASVSLPHHLCVVKISEYSFIFFRNLHNCGMSQHFFKEICRRDFLRWSGLATAATTLGQFSILATGYEYASWGE